MEIVEDKLNLEIFMQTQKEPIIEYEFVDSPNDLDRAYKILLEETLKDWVKRKRKKTKSKLSSIKPTKNLDPKSFSDLVHGISHGLE